MLEAFNSWLRGNGHNEWSKELFGPRFVQNGETVRHGVATAKPRQLHGVSRHGDWPKQLPARPAVYRGVRFQTASDKEKHESGPTGPTSSETFSYTRNSEGFPKGPTTRTNGQSEAASHCACGAELLNAVQQQRGTCGACMVKQVLP
jgi:hypothetical protein